MAPGLWQTALSADPVQCPRDHSRYLPATWIRNSISRIVTLSPRFLNAKITLYGN